MGITNYVHFERKYDYYKLALKIIDELPKQNFVRNIVLCQDGKRYSFVDKKEFERMESLGTYEVHIDKNNKKQLIHKADAERTVYIHVYITYSEEEFKKFLKPDFEELSMSLYSNTMHIHTDKYNASEDKNAVYAGFELFIIRDHYTKFLEIIDDLCSIIRPDNVYIYGDYTNLERIKKLTQPFKLIIRNDAGKTIDLTGKIRKIVEKYSGKKPIGKRIESKKEIERIETKKQEKIQRIKPKTSYKIFVLKNNRKIPATIKKDYENKKLTLKFENKKYETEFDANWFRTLRVLDSLVNKYGYRILCNGTSKHCGVMGFIATMADGSECYYMDPNARKDESKMKTVDTLEYSSWNEYVAEEEQRISFFGRKFVDFMKLDSAEVSRLMVKWKSESDKAKEARQNKK